MNLLDLYLKPKGLNRNKFSEISGIPISVLSEYNQKPLGTYKVSLIRALAAAVGDSTTDVLKELEKFELQKDILLGYRTFLEEHNCFFPALEYQMYRLIKELEAHNVNIGSFSFTQFEAKEHLDMEKDCKKAMEIGIRKLEKLLIATNRG